MFTLRTKLLAAKKKILSVGEALLTFILLKQ